jgi:metal-responsive CopG/Arc/MetJ family transcriptional regulator
MRKPRDKRRASYERVIFSLPRSLAGEVRRYADAVRNGNKSGLVADALRWYLGQIRKARHTAKLRESYSQAAEQGRQISGEWQHIDDEMWAKLDELDAQQTKAR